MKFQIIIASLIASSVLAQDLDLNAIMGQFNNPSDECKEEVTKYQECIADKANMKLSTKEEVEKFCSSFDESKCKTFFDDINKTDSVCFASDAEVKLDNIVYGSGAVSAKINYLAFCSKGSDNKVCPLSQFLTDNVDKLEKQTELSADQLKILASDCKDDKCNTRLATIKGLYEKIKAGLDKVGGGDQSSGIVSQALGSPIASNSTLTIFDKYSPLYAEKKCDSIEKADDSSDAATIKKITYAFVTMMALSAFLLF